MSVVFNHQHLAIAMYDSIGLQVSLRLKEMPPQVPAAMLEATYHRHRNRLERLREAPTHDEALRIAPVDINFGDDGLLTVTGTPRPLSHVRAMHEAYSDVLSEAAAPVFRFQRPLPGFVSSMGLHMAVLTTEGQLLVPRRSEYWMKDPGLWGASFSTDFLPVDFASGTLDDATLRLFAQLLNVEDMSAVLGSVRTVGLLVDMQTYEWYFLSIADFRGLGADFSAKRLMERRAYSMGAYEFDDCAAINLSPYEFQQLVARKNDFYDIRALAELQLIASALNQ